MTSKLMLTEKQLRVAALVADGLLNKQIAHQLGNTEGCIKGHVEAALERLGLANRVQLAVWYVRRELSAPEEPSDDRKGFTLDELSDFARHIGVSL